MKIKSARITQTSRFKLAASALLLSTLSFTANVNAAQRSDADENAEEKKVVITGSRIKKVDISNLSPILSVSRDDMDKLGYATVKEVVDGLSQNTGGTMDNSSTFGFATGASSVNLRGLGFGHTLVLIDGRRLPIYPIGIGGTSNFVDLSSIPVAFVERIDVLTDGASAVYGSDAVSGVINVITRQEIEGISLNYRFGEASDGGYQSHRFNLITGARSGDSQIDLILDYWQQEAIWATQRDYANSDVANSRGSYSAGGSSFYGLESETIYQDPNCGTENDAIGGQGIADVEVGLLGAGNVWCGFDRSLYRQLVAPQNRVSLMTRLNYEINSDLAFFSRIGYSKTRTDTQLEPVFYGGSLFEGLGSAVANNGGVIDAGAANNPTTGTANEESGVFIRRLVEFGPRKSAIENNAYNLLAGLNGSIADGQFDWELGIAFNKTILDIDSNNILLSPLHAAVDNGLDLFLPIPQEQVNALQFNAVRNSFSSNRVVDFSITGDLDAGFSAGPIQFALALEQVSQKYQDQPDPLVLQGDAFDGSSSGQGERRHSGIGAELSLPFTDSFEMDIALRFDDYDDASSVNSAFSPRLAMGYRATENLLMRFSWGKSFRAPDMQRLFGGETQGFVDILDPEMLVNETGVPCAQLSPTCLPSLVQSVQLFTYANTELTEEKGNNFNYGVVWQASENLSLSADYFDLRMDDVVTEFSPQAIVNVCFSFAIDCSGVVERDDNGSLSTSDAYIATTAFNIAEQNTSGIDFNISYDWQSELGQWSASLNSTWVRSYETKVSDDSGAVDGINLGELPEFRHNLTLDWHNDTWGATFRINYIDEMLGYYCVECGQSDMIKAWATSSVSARYNLTDYTRIRFGANNLTNKKPPQDPTQSTWPWYNNAGGYYSAVGRELYIQFETSL
jgi:iron complex outermembrane recepter protein